MPIGTILPYTGDLNKIPSGWHLCDGTDATPNLTDRFLEGTIDAPGIFKEPGLPNITGGYNTTKSQEAIHSPYGAFKETYTTGAGDSSHGGNWHQSTLYLRFNASHSNIIYGKSETVQPASYTVYYIIKLK